MNDTKNMTLDDLLNDCVNSVDFESDILSLAPKMSSLELQKHIDDRIEQVQDTSLNIEIRERLSKEAQILAIMYLRRG